MHTHACTHTYNHASCAHTPGHAHNRHMRREMSRRAHTHIERRDLSTSLPEKMMSELLVSHERDPTLPFQACHAATAVTELQLAVACRMVGAPKARTHVHTRMRRTFKTLVTNEQWESYERAIGAGESSCKEVRHDMVRSSRQIGNPQHVTQNDAHLRDSMPRGGIAQGGCA